MPVPQVEQNCDAYVEGHGTSMSEVHTHLVNHIIGSVDSQSVVKSSCDSDRFRRNQPKSTCFGAESTFAPFDSAEVRYVNLKTVPATVAIAFVIHA